MQYLMSVLPWYYFLYYLRMKHVGPQSNLLNPYFLEKLLSLMNIHKIRAWLNTVDVVLAYDYYVWSPSYLWTVWLIDQTAQWCNTVKCRTSRQAVMGFEPYTDQDLRSKIVPTTYVVGEIVCYLKMTVQYCLWYTFRIISIVIWLTYCSNGAKQNKNTSVSALWLSVCHCSVSPILHWILKPLLMAQVLVNCHNFPYWSFRKQATVRAQLKF